LQELFEDQLVWLVQQNWISRCQTQGQVVDLIQQERQMVPMIVVNSIRCYIRFQAVVEEDLASSHHDTEDHEHDERLTQPAILNRLLIHRNYKQLQLLANSKRFTE